MVQAVHSTITVLCALPEALNNDIGAPDETWGRKGARPGDSVIGDVTPDGDAWVCFPRRGSGEGLQASTISLSDVLHMSESRVIC